MVVQRETALFRNLLLAALDFGVVKLLYASALQADQVIVVRAFVELEYRLA